ncbi:MAG: dihydrofolate reductase family protein [Thermoleophilia bacterium]
MPRTIYYTGVSLDGFIADPDDSLDWLTTQDIDPAGAFGYGAFIRDIGALAMGATTYAWILDHMSGTGEDWFYEVPTWVFTHREFPALDGADIRLTRGDVAPVHAQMAAAAGERDVWVVGGGDLAGQFADRGLLDEVIVSIAPVTLGAGAPLLPRRLDMELLETARNRAFVAARYAVTREGAAAP